VVTEISAQNKRRFDITFIMLSSLSSISLLTTLVSILISCLIPQATAFSYHHTSIVTSQQQSYTRDSTTAIAMSSSSTLTNAFCLHGKTALITVRLVE